MYKIAAALVAAVGVGLMFAMRKWRKRDKDIVAEFEKHEE